MLLPSGLWPPCPSVTLEHFTSPTLPWIVNILLYIKSFLKSLLHILPTIVTILQLSKFQNLYLLAEFHILWMFYSYILPYIFYGVVFSFIIYRIYLWIPDINPLWAKYCNKCCSLVTCLLDLFMASFVMQESSFCCNQIEQSFLLWFVLFGVFKNICFLI